MATPTPNSVPLSSDPLLAGLLQGSSWTFPDGNRTITYSFYNTAWSYWLPTGESVVTAVLGTIASYIDVNFVRVAATAPYNSASDLSFFVSGFGVSSYFHEYGLLAIGVFPDPNFGNQFLANIGELRQTVPKVEGDVFFENFYNQYNYTNAGGITRPIIYHETLHALGLKHQHDGGGNYRPTFSQLGINRYDDADYTVMSYDINNGSLSSGNWNTPSILDIQALQAIYGVNRTTAAGDTRYRLDDTCANQAIRDAGGNDLFDASSARSPVTIDLRSGGFSIVGSTKYAIAFGTIIENAGGGTGNDTIIGNDANNILIGNAGNDSLEGNGGIDTALYNAARTRYTVTHTADTIVVTGPEGTDTLHGIERLKFIDGTLVVDPADPAFAIYRLYNAALNRPPDQAGLTAWAQAATGGVAMADIAHAFLLSGEFNARFGAPDAQGYVTLLYNNVLHRNPDPAGLANWTYALASGAQSVEQVLLGFCDSPENVALIGIQAGNGIWLV